MERYDLNTQLSVEDERIDAFLDEVIAVGRKYGYSIAHEDNHGAFMVEESNETNYLWLRKAYKNLGNIG